MNNAVSLMVARADLQLSRDFIRGGAHKANTHGGVPSIQVGVQRGGVVAVGRGGQVNRAGSVLRGCAVDRA
jgi:hypothetical protein